MVHFLVSKEEKNRKEKVAIITPLHWTFEGRI